MSQDLTKDELKQLAGIAGFKKVEGRQNAFFEYWTNGQVQYIGWKPYEDLNQAFECFRGMNKGNKYSLEIMYNDFGGDEAIECLLEPEPLNPDITYMNQIILTAAKSEALAICKAVLEASK